MTIFKRTVSKRIKTIYKYIINILFYLSLVFILWVILQFVFITSFKVNSDSMQPSIKQGESILVNKTIPGARVFNLFASLRGEQVKIKRLPGVHGIQKGDILVFNDPFPYGNKKIRMHIMKYIVKRCVGLPGDSLKEFGINNITPIYIPKSGDVISINYDNYLLYHKLIAWEQQGVVELRDSLVYLNGVLLTEYRFLKNYYYVLGDNAEFSHDSRFWGLLPEEYIVGKAWIIWKSKDPYKRKFRWNRIMKKL